MSDFWNHIDGVLVINLDHRTDRWEELSSELKEFIPEEKIHRMSAVYGKQLPSYRKHRLFKSCTEEESLFWAGRAGCVLSHTHCIQEAQKRQWKNVLILEDDATFFDDLKGSVGDMLCRVMQNTPDWGIIYPGYAPYDNQGALIDCCEHPSLGRVQALRIMGPLNTHCMLIHEAQFARMLKKMPHSEADVWHWVAMNLGYDSWIANDYGRRAGVTIIGLDPIICEQSDSVSDIEDMQRGAVKSEVQDNVALLAKNTKAISADAFRRRFRSPSFIFKRTLKILMHYVLGCFYYLVGFRKFKVSVANAGYWGAFKAALGVLRSRKK